MWKVTGRLIAISAALGVVGGVSGVWSGAEAQPRRPIVKVVATGGTIANTEGGRISVDQIIAELPEVKAIADLRVEEIIRVGSASLTYQHLIDTAKAIERIFAKEPEIDGIVVTIGSNTSEEMAYFLNLAVHSDKPIAVTAAQRARGSRSEDSSRNFIDAVITASSPDARGKGVMLVVNELIHSARDVTKSVVSRVDTWQSPDIGALGVVSGGKAVFYRTPTRRHTTKSEFTLNGISKASQLPKVEVIYSHIDADPGLIRAAVTELGAQGVVVAGLATGRAHMAQDAELQQIAERRGIPVVMGNRGGSGRISSTASTSTEAPPYIGADNLTPQKAHILLKFALTVTKDRREIQRIFNEY
jgi:L-asparaginase type II